LTDLVNVVTYYNAITAHWPLLNKYHKSHSRTPLPYIRCIAMDVRVTLLTTGLLVFFVRNEVTYGKFCR